MVDPAEEAAADILEMREEMQKAVAPVNAANPFTEGALGVAPTGGGGAGVVPSAKWMEALSHPAFQAYLKLLTDSSFLDTLKALTQHPNRLNLVYAEIAWFFLLMLFRSWRFGKAKGFLGRLWIRFYTFGLGTGVGSLLIPYLLLGDGFKRVITQVAEASLEVILKLI